MIDMPPIETFAPPALVHLLPWRNSTVGEPYFLPKKAETKLDVAPDNSSGSPVEVKPSVDNGSIILNRLRTFKSWKRNWDGDGAAAPNVDAIETATNFLSLWSPKKARPEITLTHDGYPMFIIATARLFGEIIVNGDNTVDYFFELLDGTLIQGEVVNYKSSEMLNIIKDLT